MLAMLAPSVAIADVPPTPASSDPPALAILNPADIIPQQDYPASSRRAGEEGAVTVKLTADATGALRDCEVTTSSGHKALDDQTCASIRLHGKFQALGSPNQADGTYARTTTIRWMLPSSGPRGLFLGVTLTSSQPASGGRTRCQFSDGLVLFVAKGSDCVAQLPEQEIVDGDKRHHLNIVDAYLDRFQHDPKPEYAFNIAAILAANRYDQAVDYMTIASDKGLALASFFMCGLHATPNNALRDGYNPKEAVRRCLMAQQQGFDLGMIILQRFVEAHPDAATDEQQRFITAYVPSIPTTDATLAVPQDTLFQKHDYPKDALKHNIQGRTLAVLRINAEGRVDSCLILQSSLSLALDDRVCQRLTAAASYKPATMLTQPISTWKTQIIHWRINKANNGLGSAALGALLGFLIGGAL